MFRVVELGDVDAATAKLAEVGTGVPHAERNEDALGEEVHVLAPRCSLDDDLREREAVVGIPRHRARIVLQRAARKHFQQHGVRGGVEPETDEDGDGRQTRRVIEQHAYRDRAIARVRHGEFRDVAGDGRVEIDFAFLHEQEDRRGGEHLGDRADVESRVRVHRAIARTVGHPDPLGIDELATLHDRHAHAAPLPRRDRFPRGLAGLRDGVGELRAGNALRSRARSEREQAYAGDEESRTAIHAGLPRTGHASVVCASTAVASSIKHHAIAIRLSK